MLVDHHTVNHGGLASVVKVQMDASPWFNQVVIDLSADFVHVTNRLVEHANKKRRAVYLGIRYLQGNATNRITPWIIDDDGSHVGERLH